MLLLLLFGTRKKAGPSSAIILVCRPFPSRNNLASPNAHFLCCCCSAFCYGDCLPGYNISCMHASWVGERSNQYSQSDDDSWEDLATFGYKLNMKIQKYKTSFYILWLPPCIEIWQFFIKIKNWSNSGYRKSQKAIHFSTFNS